MIKGFAKGLGLEDSDQVKSPTYVLMHIYQAKVPIYHFDLYRLGGRDDFETIGLADFLRDNAVVCVEWPEKAESFMPEKRWNVFIESVSETERKIKVVLEP